MLKCRESRSRRRWIRRPLTVQWSLCPCLLRQWDERCRADRKSAYVSSRLLLAYLYASLLAQTNRTVNQRSLCKRKKSYPIFSKEGLESHGENSLNDSKISLGKRGLTKLRSYCSVVFKLS